MAVIFHPRQKAFDPPFLPINNTAIEVVRQFKTLGIIFTDNMSWNDHVDYLAQKLSRTAGYLRRYCSSFPI